MRKSEEPRKDAHRHRVGALPAVDGLNALPLLLLDEGHESIHIACASVAAELTVCDVKDGGQGGDEEAPGQPRIFTAAKEKYR